MSKRKKSSGGGSSNAWMATFSDLLMLMLTFFVLLLTMSSMDSKQVKAMQQAAGVMPGQGDDLAREDALPQQSSMSILPPLPLPSPPPIEGAPTIAPPPQGGGPLDAGVERLVSPLQRAGKGWLKREPGALVMHVEGDALFDERGQLSLQGRALLTQAVGLIQAHPSAHLSAEVFLQGGGDRWAQDQAHLDALDRADLLAQAALRAGIRPERLEIMGLGRALGDHESHFVRHADLVRLTITHPITSPASSPPTPPAPAQAPAQDQDPAQAPAQEPAPDERHDGAPRATPPGDAP